MSRDTTIDDALKEIPRGRMVVVSDSLERENEADLVMAAQKATAADINFMIRHGGGLICAALTRERALKLGLSSMVPEEENTQPLTVMRSITFRICRIAISCSTMRT
jgi:3,4-dihydroxy 2-butanone 4-phosphate synthase / GTP cyclohydrolase II